MESSPTRSNSGSATTSIDKALEVCEVLSGVPRGMSLSDLARAVRQPASTVHRLLALLTAALPEHPAFFPADATTDQPETFYVAEVIRERIFHLTREEVPYAVAVRVDELVERRRPERLDIRATIFVEHDSQKGILIGKGGAMLKRIGTDARRELERFFGIQVFLGLTVDVRRNWRRDPRALREFGFRLTS